MTSLPLSATERAAAKKIALEIQAWRSSFASPDARHQAMAEALLRYEATLEAAEAQIGVLTDALREAAEQFKFYAHNHYKKSPPDIEKAQTNAEWADKCLRVIKSLSAAVQAERECGAKLEAAVECAWVSHPNMSGYGCNFCDAPRVDSPNAEVKHTHDCAVYSIRSPGKATP